MLLVLSGFSAAPPAMAKSDWKSPAEYRLGVEFAPEVASTSMPYDAPLREPLPETCRKTDDAHMHCIASLFPAPSSGFGLVVQRVFRRQGLFYFDAGLAGDLHTLTASLPNHGLDPAETDQTKTRPPIQTLDVKLYMVGAGADVTLGLTPRYLPDLLLTTGLFEQLATGTVTVNGSRRSRTYTAVRHSATVEMVYARFGSGSLSLYATYSAQTTYSQSLYNDQATGVGNLKLLTGSFTLGLLKLVLPIPWNS